MPVKPKHRMHGLIADYLHTIQLRQNNDIWSASRKMKNCLFLALFLLWSKPATSQNPGDNIFSGIQVFTINIQFSQPNYWDSLTYYYDEGLERYMVATVIIDGVTYDSVGVRLKGNASYSHPNNKKSFRLSFDEYLDGLRWDELKGVHLNNCWGDPTFMREKLHLDFCRDADVSAPRANYARVMLNDTLWGFYSMVEHVDKKFLESRYEDNSGDLFKAVDAFGGGNPPVSDLRWYGTDTTLYYPRYELKTDGSTTAWTQLVRLIDTINNNTNTAGALPNAVNLYGFYKTLSADILFANLDAYVNSGRNFYFYFHPVSHKMEWIVWDTGLSFGSYSGGLPAVETMSVAYVVNATTRPLIGKIHNTPALKSAYLDVLCSMYHDYFSSTRLFPKIDTLANRIRPYVYEDPRKMYTTTQFETNITTDINASGGGGSRKPGLKSFINLRQASVSSQLSTLGISCDVTLHAGDVVINEFMAQNDSILDPDGEAEDWIELYNNTADTLDLTGTFLTDDPATPAKWRFPDSTRMAPGAYLIVWADEDSGQIGLHANFKLSADGEHIRLSNVDSSVVDSTTYGAQTGNRSLARVPNGTGAFFACRPTFGTMNSADSILVDPVMTSVLLPQYIEGVNGTNSNRIPYAFRLAFTGLLPGATYRFTNQIVTSADGATTSGSGNCIFVSPTGDFVRTSSPSLATAGAYGTFTTSNDGTYEGWFVTEPTGNVRFVPGRYVFARIALNDGISGTTPSVRLTTTDSIRVVKLDTTAGDSTGTGLRATTSAAAKDFVLAYDHTDGSTRPVSGTFIENDGSDNSTSNNYAAFYSNHVNGVNGAFGMVLPNDLPNGVRRFERRSLSSGDVVALATDADGVWPSGVSTVNPSGGISEITLSGSDVGDLITDVESPTTRPSEFRLSQNFPNPFNPTTVIEFSLPEASFVRLEVFNVLGQRVATLLQANQAAGTHSVSFNTAGLSSGIYFYRITAGAGTKTKRMLLLK